MIRNPQDKKDFSWKDQLATEGHEAWQEGMLEGGAESDLLTWKIHKERVGVLKSTWEARAKLGRKLHIMGKTGED